MAIFRNMANLPELKRGTAILLGVVAAIVVIATLIVLSSGAIRISDILNVMADTSPRIAGFLALPFVIVGLVVAAYWFSKKEERMWKDAVKKTRAAREQGAMKKYLPADGRPYSVQAMSRGLQAVHVRVELGPERSCPTRYWKASPPWRLRPSRVVHWRRRDGRRPRPLQEKATGKLWPRVSQYARAQRQARMPQSRWPRSTHEARVVVNVDLSCRRSAPRAPRTSARAPRPAGRRRAGSPPRGNRSRPAPARPGRAAAPMAGAP